jgi:hypothetical protein
MMQHNLTLQSRKQPGCQSSAASPT